MKDKNVWVESGAIHSKKSPEPLAINKIEQIFVKEHDAKSRVKKSALIGAVLAFPFFIWHPLYGLAAFIAIFSFVFVTTKQYELLVTVFNNSEIGSVESTLASSSSREEFDELINQVFSAKS